MVDGCNPSIYDFDRSYVHEYLLRIIEELENIGYPVVVIAHDLGPTNLHFGIILRYSTESKRIKSTKLSKGK